MSTDLEAAVARLTEWTTPPAPPGIPQHDARLLLADWQRLRTAHQKREELWRQRVRSMAGVHRRVQAERDAARAEVERLKAELTSEREQWAGFVDACAQVGVTWTMREPTPEHPIGVEIRNAAVTELSRLRERDARVRALLERLLDLDADPELREAIALLKETP